MKHSYPVWIYIFMGMAILSSLFTACTKMDDTYHDFWKNGEKSYPASPDSLKTFSGKNRIELMWLLIGDPTISNAVIYWNNKTDSMEVPLKNRTNDGIDTIRVMLKDLPEGNYSFDIYTYDEVGNRSVVANATGHSYGEEYVSSLLGRLIKGASYNKDTATIVWGDPADASSIGVEVIYKDTNDVEQQLFIPPHADSTFIGDFAFAAGSTIQYRTLYVPDSTSIDTFYTAYEKTKVLGPRTLLPKAGWSVLDYSSYDNRNGRTDRLPEKGIDDNTSTSWVNLVGPTNFPHTFSIDMGQEMEDIYGASLYVGGTKETPNSMNVYISNNGTDWQLLGLYSVEKTKGRQYFDFNQPQSFRYIRFKFMDSYGSNNIIMYEMGVYTR